jgi:pimeloyl-ACP methyl ester carboxylesterase
VRSLLSSGRLGLGGSFEDAARAVRAPTLVVWGRDDAWVPPSDADRFLAAVAGSRKIVLSECGHVPQEEHPEEVSSLLADFLTPPAWGP